MATKKNTGAKAPKAEENKVQQNAAETAAENGRPQYKVPFISAKIDRLNDNPDSKIKANASVFIGHHFVQDGFKVYDGGEKGLTVLYPGQKGSDGKFYNDFRAITKEGREAINKYVLEAYEQKLEQTQGDSHTQSDEQSEEEDIDEDEEPAFEQTMQAFSLNN